MRSHRSTKQILANSMFACLLLEGEPSARIYALWKHQNAYTDSLGTHQADRDFATGRASGGMKLTYPLAWTESIALAPAYLGKS
jgi:hypothetical protein